MSTAAPYAPPLRAVWTPQDAVDTAEAVSAQRHQMGRFLSARSVLLSHVRSAGATAAELLDRWHLGGALAQVRRACGWLIGGLALIRRCIVAV